MLQLIFKIIYLMCYVVAQIHESVEPSIPESATLKSSRQLLNKPDKPNAGRHGDLSISTAEKYIHELKTWALDVLNRKHREHAKSQMRTILRNTDSGYVAISPSKITCMFRTSFSTATRKGLIPPKIAPSLCIAPSQRSNTSYR